MKFRVSTVLDRRVYIVDGSAPFSGLTFRKIRIDSGSHAHIGAADQQHQYEEYPDFQRKGPRERPETGDRLRSRHQEM